MDFFFENCILSTSCFKNTNILQTHIRTRWPKRDLIYVQLVEKRMVPSGIEPLILALLAPRLNQLGQGTISDQMSCMIIKCNYLMVIIFVISLVFIDTNTRNDYIKSLSNIMVF